MREGTLTAALLTGNFVKVYMRLFKGKDRKVYGNMPKREDRNRP